MPYAATTFNVMIASPGDVQAERNLAREVIHEWNAVNSMDRAMVLLPVGWDTHASPSMGDRAQGVLNKQILDKSDLLVAIFWTRLGTPTGEAESGSVEEIEKHLKAGKPAMLYFSSVPVRPDSVDDLQFRALRDFRERMKEKGLIETFASQTEFRAKFARQLAATVNQHALFQTASGPPLDNVQGAGLLTVLNRQIPELSTEARALLSAAVADPNGTILSPRFLSGEEIMTNGKQFIEQGNARSRAAWVGALDELSRNRLIETHDSKRQVFQVTREGYSMAEVIAGT